MTQVNSSKEKKNTFIFWCVKVQQLTEEKQKLKAGRSPLAGTGVKWVNYTVQSHRHFEGKIRCQ